MPKKNKKIVNYGSMDDVTKYGEFIPSFHKWLTPDEQRMKAAELAECSDESKSEDR